MAHLTSLFGLIEKAKLELIEEANLKLIVEAIIFCIFIRFVGQMSLGFGLIYGLKCGLKCNSYEPN